MKAGERLKATYQFKPVDHLVRQEFYIWDEAITRWKKEGLPIDYQEKNLFNFDPFGMINTGINIGWCEPPFSPYYEEKVIKNEDDTEIIQDTAGRWVKVFKGRRHGFMPTYIKHPVASKKDWDEEVILRLNPDDINRYKDLEKKCNEVKKRVIEEGIMVRQGIIGGYMYLRALMGPEDLLYAFYDKPELIHAMMQQWVKLMNTYLEKIQSHINIDELMLAEDICYNKGLLVSPDTVKNFLIPYYQEVINKVRKRQKNKIYLHIDTDGWAGPAIPLYLEVGMNAMSPWEVASGCDVVKIGNEWPNLIISGGIDKRILAQNKNAIDKHLEYIIPVMVKRGGYIPTCDHGVPDDVNLENYLYYRKRVCELDN